MHVLTFWMRSDPPVTQAGGGGRRPQWRLPSHPGEADVPHCDGVTRYPGRVTGVMIRVTLNLDRQG